MDVNAVGSGDPTAQETLYDGSLDSGQHTMTWDAGSEASGIYFCRLRADNKVETLQMVLLK